MKVENKEAIKHYALNNKILDLSIGHTVNVDATSFDKIDYNCLYDVAEKFILLTDANLETGMQMLKGR